MLIKSTIWVLVGLLFGSAYAQNPYAVFGHETEVFYDEQEHNYYWQLINPNRSSDTIFVEYQPLKGHLLCINPENFIVGSLALDPKQIIRFMGVDPLEKDYPSMGPYTFVANTPINAIDPDGRLIIFVNGFYTSPILPFSTPPLFFFNGSLSFINKKLDEYMGFSGGESYWGYGFAYHAASFFNDHQSKIFVDGTGGFFSSGTDRYSAGYEWAKLHYGELVANVLDDRGVQKEAVNIVAHSMGSAYAEGIINYLEERNIQVSTVLHLSPADVSDFEASKKPLTVQLDYENDGTLMYKNFDDAKMLNGVDVYGEAKTDESLGVQLLNSHGRTKADPTTFHAISDLLGIRFHHVGNTKSFTNGGLSYSQGNYISTGDAYGTRFGSILKNGDAFGYDQKSKTYTGKSR